MKRLIGMALMICLTFVVTSGVVHVNEVRAANGYEQWTDGWSDGCFYYWDGYAYTQSACGEANGSFNLYYGDAAGNWVYWFSTGSYADGSVWMYYQGVTYVQSGIPAPTIATITASNGSSSTGYNVIDSIMAGLNSDIGDNGTAPICIEIVRDTCYIN